MERRRVIHLAGLATAGTVIPGGGPPCSRPRTRPFRRSKPKLTGRRTWPRYLRSIVPVDEPSVDRIVVGDPATPDHRHRHLLAPLPGDLPRRRCATASTCSSSTSRRSTPTGTSTRRAPTSSAPLGRPPEPTSRRSRRRRRWILDQRARRHPLPRRPRQGRRLGHPLRLRPSTWDSATATSSGPAPTTTSIASRRGRAAEVARSIAAKLAGFRQPGVAFYGDRRRVVGSVGVGTGCYSDPIEFMDLRPDLFITLDDIVRTWTQTVYARDTGLSPRRRQPRHLRGGRRPSALGAPEGHLPGPQGRPLPPGLRLRVGDGIRRTAMRGTRFAAALLAAGLLALPALAYDRIEVSVDAPAARAGRHGPRPRPSSRRVRARSAPSSFVRPRAKWPSS
ncbi:MAG: hypothetical protein MZV64_10675 [Ignavibacteriales bacterium]|nr:hypothetical protein [Ignavibacteriales bacterium]